MRADVRSLAAVTLLALFAALPAAVAARDAKPRAEALPRMSPAHYAPGAGRALAERSCQICHSPMLVTQQAKDSTGWEKTLATMGKWGAELTPAEHDTLLHWLLTTQGPRAAK